MSLTESSLHPETAAFRHVIPAGEPYLFEVKAGQTLRLLDLEGNQAVDTLFFSAKTRASATTRSAPCAGRTASTSPSARCSIRTSAIRF